LEAAVQIQVFVVPTPARTISVRHAATATSTVQQAPSACSPQRLRSPLFPSTECLVLVVSKELLALLVHWICVEMPQSVVQMLVVARLPFTTPISVTLKMKHTVDCMHAVTTTLKQGSQAANVAQVALLTLTAIARLTATCRAELVCLEQARRTAVSTSDPSTVHPMCVETPLLSHLAQMPFAAQVVPMIHTVPLCTNAILQHQPVLPAPLSLRKHNSLKTSPQNAFPTTTEHSVSRGDA